MTENIKSKKYYLNEVESISNNDVKRMFDFYKSIPDEFKSNLKFILNLIEVKPIVFCFFEDGMRRNLFLMRSLMEKLVKSRTDRTHTFLFLPESRLSVAHEMFNKSKYFEEKFSFGLIEKLNGIGINEYVEKINLNKKLEKELAKNKAKENKRKI